MKILVEKMATTAERLDNVQRFRLPVIHELERRLNAAVPGDMVWCLNWNRQHRVYHANSQILDDIYHAKENRDIKANQETFFTLIKDRYHSWRNLSGAWAANGALRKNMSTFMLPRISGPMERDVIRALFHPYVVLFHEK